MFCIKTNTPKQQDEKRNKLLKILTLNKIIENQKNNFSKTRHPLCCVLGRMAKWT